ncbi:hypothetical protein BC940DRAFT_322654 [Gongronella butleri]|nr:hypothetical protein BC940DRAFT_322654 [Gongronella butleri]
MHHFTPSSSQSSSFSGATGQAQGTLHRRNDQGRSSKQQEGKTSLTTPTLTYNNVVVAKQDHGVNNGHEQDDDRQIRIARWWKNHNAKDQGGQDRRGAAWRMIIWIIILCKTMCKILVGTIVASKIARKILVEENKQPQGKHDIVQDIRQARTCCARPRWTTGSWRSSSCAKQGAKYWWARPLREKNMHNKQNHGVKQALVDQIKVDTILGGLALKSG